MQKGAEILKAVVQGKAKVQNLETAVALFSYL